jgi:hypothetical protein
MGMGMRELDRAQFRMASTRVVKKPCPLLALDPAMRVYRQLQREKAVGGADPVDRYAPR